MRRLVATLRVALALVLLAFGASTAFGQKVEVTSSSPPEAKLAAIDLGTPYVERSLIQRYGRLLNNAQRWCTQSRTRIADMTAKSVEILREQYGKRVTNLQVLEFFDTMMREAKLSEKQDCAPLFTLVVIGMGGT